MVSKHNSIVVCCVLIALQAMSGVGFIFVGWSSDHFDLRIVMLLSTLGSTLLVFCVWGLSKSIPPLYVFSALYGFLAPSWAGLWPRFGSAVSGDDPQTASTLMTIFLAGTFPLRCSMNWNDTPRRKRGGKYIIWSHFNWTPSSMGVDGTHLVPLRNRWIRE